MLKRNTLSVVLLPGEVLYDGFLSADTVTVGILALSSAENAALVNKIVVQPFAKCTSLPSYSCSR